MSDGIEKLQKYAFGMKPRRCDDILLLADQIQREHVSELQAIEKRYKTDLREAREARDIAIKEAAELRDRLMPHGMEWPRFEDGERVEFGSAVDGLDSPCEKFIFTRSMGGVCQLQDADGNMVNVIHGERVKSPEPEVLAADGLPIKVGDTVYHEVDGSALVVTGFGDCEDDERMVYVDWKWSCVRCLSVSHTQPDTQECINEEIDECSLDDWCAEHPDGNIATMIHHYCARQRELDARTMGGE